MLYMKFSTGTFGSLVLVSFFPTLTGPEDCPEIHKEGEVTKPDQMYTRLEDAKRSI